MSESKQSAGKSSYQKSMDLADARSALSQLGDEAEAEASTISRAFIAAGQEIESALTRAAHTGELNFANMAEAVLQSIARILIDDLFKGPLEDFSGLANLAVRGLIGQRAEGGPVLAGERYLVGERGPEVFVPPGAGSIQPVPNAGPVNIVIYASGDGVESIRRSERQITAAVARATQAGWRSLLASFTMSGFRWRLVWRPAVGQPGVPKSMNDLQVLKNATHAGRTHGGAGMGRRVCGPWMMWRCYWHFLRPGKGGCTRSGSLIRSITNPACRQKSRARLISRSVSVTGCRPNLC